MKNLFVILLFSSAVFCYGQFARISDASASSYLSDSGGSYKAVNLIAAGAGTGGEDGIYTD